MRPISSGLLDRAYHHTMMTVIALGEATRGPNTVSDASFALAGERGGAAVVTLRFLQVFVVRKVRLDLFKILGSWLPPQDQHVNSAEKTCFV